MTFKEGIVGTVLILGVAVSAIFLISEMNTKTILKVYTDNVNQFVDTIEENKGVDFMNYKYKLNSRINCVDKTCSYKTEYKNEMVTNTDVVIQLKADNTPEKIVYKLEAIRRIDSMSEETRKDMQNYYRFLEHDLKKKNVDVYYTNTDNKIMNLDECVVVKDCLFVVKFK